MKSPKKAPVKKTTKSSNTDAKSKLKGTANASEPIKKKIDDEDDDFDMGVDDLDMDVNEFDEFDDDDDRY